MPRFLTLFVKSENVHLIKDVGMIPYILHKDFDYDSTIASYKNGEYPYMNTDVKGLKQVFISQISKFEILNVCLFILKNFRKYDVLQCYHISKETIIYLILFKLLKTITFTKSATYVKLDIDEREVSKGFSKKVKLVLKHVNILSVETKKMTHYMNRNNILGKKVAYIPNGFYHSKERENIDFKDKENLIITVGRIGNFQKNNELLLEGFKDFATQNLDWKLELIGPIEEGFNSYIENYFSENPNLISRVTFVGNISDRNLLEQKYKKAKIFVLTSPWESFGIVLVEAISKGCFLITTNFSSAHDITDNQKYGLLFESGDSKKLTELMLKVADNPALMEESCNKVQDFAYNNFSLKKICADINLLVKKAL
ncbi:glycosyltransferase family 4 protein [Flavobacterium sp. 3-210]